MIVGGHHTVWVPDIGQELHGRRRKRIVLGKLELGGEHATLERSPFRALNQSLPVEEIIFGYRPSRDSFWGVIREGPILLEQAAMGR